MDQNLHGFSIVELIVVCGIVIALSGMISLNILGIQHGASLSATIEQVSADVAHVRLQSLSGYGATSSKGDAHGVHFESSAYTLFTGTSYASGNTANTVISLPSNMRFTQITFPSQSVVFATGSGEIVSYDQNKSSFDITETNSSQTKTMRLNALGSLIAH
jgi:type II secretory pathway pseudopilin PulG